MKQLGIYILGILCIGILTFFHPEERKNDIVQTEKTEGLKEEFLLSFSKYAKEIPIQVETAKKPSGEWLFTEEEKKTEPWVSENGEVFYPANGLEQLFHSSVLSYPNGDVVVEQGEKKKRYREEVLWKDKIPFLALKMVAQDFQYEIDWNRKTGEVVLIGKTEKILPKQYDARRNGKVTKVRDQGRYGSCWAFGAIGAMESSLLPGERFLFAPDHMTKHSGFYLEAEEGGEYNMSIAYLASWKGPVLEEDDPYGDGYSPKYLASVKHLEEAVLLPEKDYEAIKRAVFLYGGVETNIFTSLKSASSWSQYYNKETSAYYFSGNLKPNHDVIIVGWDDEYPKENFSKMPEGDGAFICKNSWGVEFGEEGYFYVSYYDSVIGTNNVVYSKIGNSDNFDYIYQTDELGWVGQLGYNRPDAWFANVYESAGKEELKAVSFYATMANTSYEVYVVPNFYNEDSLQERELMASGTLEQAGYYTVRLEEGVLLEAGQKYAVVVKINTPEAIHPIAIEYYRDMRTSTFTIGNGEGYVSLYGIDWTRTETKQNANVCLKAFTDGR